MKPIELDIRFNSFDNESPLGLGSFVYTKKSNDIAFAISESIYPKIAFAYIMSYKFPRNLKMKCPCITGWISHNFEYFDQEELRKQINRWTL